MTGFQRPGSRRDRLAAALEKSWRQDKPPSGLRPLGALYGWAAGLRRRWLPIFKKPFEAGVPVLGVGNLTVGGSGKTPMCLTLASIFLESGLKPAILSRGYGRQNPAPGSATVVSRGRGPEVGPAEGGDEPWLMASKLPQALVVVDADRARAARLAVGELGARVLILDDGYQQLALAGNRRLLLIPARQPFGNGAVLPAGPLREPMSAHRLADLLITTGAEAPSTETLALAEGRPAFAAAYHPLGWRRPGSDQLDPPEFMSGRRVLAFCGLGRPESFRESLSRLGLDLRRFLALRDHQQYDQGVLEALGLEFMASGAEFLVTTAKDAVKIPPDFPLPIRYLDMNMTINEPDRFRDAVLRLAR